LKKLPRFDVWQSNLWITVVAEVLTILAFQAGQMLVPYYIQQMGITDLRQVGEWTGYYQSVGSITFAIATPIWGILGDRYGRKPMLVRAMVACVVVLALTGLARTPRQLMVLRIIQGCFTGTPAAAAALIATGSPKERLAYGLGLVQTGLFIGSSLGPMVGGYIADAYGYRATFYVGALITLVPALLVITLVREPAESVLATARARLENPLAGFKSLLGLPQLLLLIGLTFTINLIYGLLGPVLPVFIQQLVSNPSRLASIAGTISGVAAFSAAVSALTVGRFSDRIGHRRTLLGCAVGTALLYFPQAYARSATMLGWFRGLQGFFQGGMSPSTSALVVTSAPKEKTGTALGLSSSASSVGFAIGPILGALLLAATSSRVVFLVSGGVFLLVAGAVALVDGQARRHAA
jgi:MFS transporter, DHA1 family, multidrug resistance protein